MKAFKGPFLALAVLSILGSLMMSAGADQSVAEKFHAYQESGDNLEDFVGVNLGATNSRELKGRGGGKGGSGGGGSGGSSGGGGSSGRGGGSSNRSRSSSSSSMGGGSGGGVSSSGRSGKTGTTAVVRHIVYGSSSTRPYGD